MCKKFLMIIFSLIFSFIYVPLTYATSDVISNNGSNIVSVYPGAYIVYTPSDLSNYGTFLKVGGWLSNADFNAVNNLHNLFVAVADDKTIWYSKSGKDWTIVDWGSDKHNENFYAITYGAGTDGKGMYVAVGQDAIAAYSQNGETNWVVGDSLQGSGDLNDVIWGNGRFVTVGDSQIWYSGDGITWYQANGVTGGPNFTAVIYVKDSDKNLDLYVAVSDSAETSDTSRIWYSTDGIYWNETKDPGPNSPHPYASFNAITYANGTFVAVANYDVDNGGYVWYSTNGIDWYQSKNPLDPINFYSVAYGHGVFVTVGDTYKSDTATPIWYSEDGVIWTKAQGFVWSNQLEAYPPFSDVQYMYADDGGAYFYAVYTLSYTDPNLSEVMCFSNDGIHWTQIGQINKECGSTMSTIQKTQK